LVLAKHCFEKMYMLRNIFWVFVKNRKVLEKFLVCKGVLKIQICSGKNRKNQEKQNVEG